MASPADLLSDEQFLQLAKSLNAQGIQPQGQATLAQGQSEEADQQQPTAPHQVNVWGKSGKTSYDYNGPGGTAQQTGRMDFPISSQPDVQAILNSSSPEDLKTVAASLASPKPIAGQQPFDYSSWPKTGGWSRPSGAPATSGDANDFFGPSGNILSSLTDTDRLNNPYAYDAAMRNLGNSQLLNQQARDMLAFQKQHMQGSESLERQKIDASTKNAQITADAHVKAAELAANAHTSPSAIRGAVVTELLKQYGTDPVRLRQAVDALNESLSIVGPNGGQHGPPMGSPAAAVPPVAPTAPAATPAPAAAPLPMPAALPNRDEQRAADKGILDLRRDVAPQMGTRQKPTDPLIFDSSRGVDSINKLADSMNQRGLYKNQAAMKQMISDIDAGIYGEPEKVWNAVAQAAGANQLLTQMPPDLSSNMSPIPEFPAQYHVPGVQSDGIAFTLERAPSGGNAQFGPIMSSQMQRNAGFLPYTQIRMPNGIVIPFDPTDATSMVKRYSGGMDARKQAAPARAATLISLLEGRNK